MSIFYHFRLVWESRTRRPGAFRPRISRGYVGMGTDKGKTALPRRTGPRSSRHERNRLGEPVLLFLRDNWTCPRNVRTVLHFKLRCTSYHGIPEVEFVRIQRQRRRTTRRICLLDVLPGYQVSEHVAGWLWSAR